MKILFISHYPYLYGANRSLLALIDGMEKYGVKSFVILPKEGDLTDELKKRKVQFRVYGFKSWMFKRYYHKHPLIRCVQLISFKWQALQRWLNNKSLASKIAIVVDEWGVEIIYSNSGVIVIGSMIAKCTGLPHIWHIREFGDLDYKLYYDWGKTHAVNRIMKSAAVNFVSHALKEHITGDKRHHDNIHVVYNGVIKNRLLMQLIESETKKTSESFVFAIVGVISESKGQFEAVTALAELSKRKQNVQMLIVGGHGELDELQKYIKSLGLQSKVKFTKFIDDPFDIYKQADCILVCSKNEAMGRVTAEALAAGKIVIGYDHAGTSELIEHEKTGLLYSNGPSELAGLMAKIMDNSSWAIELGKAGQRVAEEKFTVEKYAKNIYSILQDVISEK